VKATGLDASTGEYDVFMPINNVSNVVILHGTWTGTLEGSGTTYTTTFAPIQTDAGNYRVRFGVGTEQLDGQSLHSTFSSPFLVNCNSAVPTCPSGTVSFTSSAGGVQLTWLPVVGALVYDVYRSLPGGTPQRIGQTSLTAYSDSDVVGGTTYDYIIGSEVGNDQSPYCDPIEVTASGSSAAPQAAPVTVATVTAGLAILGLLRLRRN
jgi:hypothetical protein